jgi:hypothetical protein
VLPLTVLTTSETPVLKDGDSEHACAGTSAAGALDLATKGEWGGGWSEGFGYGVETIEGVDYPFGGADRWAFWLDDQPVGVGTGVCGAELSSGDSLLFFGECVSKEANVCPSTAPNEGKGKKRPARTVRIGTAGFSIAGDEARTVKVDLDAAGSALLKADHGRLRASLAILELAPNPQNTQTKTVQLEADRATLDTGS